MESLKFLQQFDSSSNSQNSENTSHQKKVKAVKGRYLQVSSSVPVDPVIDPEFGSCFNCWEFDHTFQTCPQPKLRNFCHNCGRQGERVDTCPRCYIAYKKNLLERTQNLIQNYSEGVAHHEKLVEDKKDELQLDITSTCQSTSNGTEEEYFSCEEEENYYGYIVDESYESSNVSGDLLNDFLSLNDVIKNLPIETQNAILLCFVGMRCKPKEQPVTEKLSELYIRKVQNVFTRLMNFFRVLIQKFL